MIRKQTSKAEPFIASEDEQFYRLRQLAARKLQSFSVHIAGKGSWYVTIGDYKIRFADHEETSKYHDEPHINCVNRDLSEEEYQRIESGMDYPRLRKKTALALHVGLTVPKLKKLLTPDCYEDVCESPEFYSNTFTQYVRVTPALELLTKAGITTRIPIAQEVWSQEDFAGW